MQLRKIKGLSFDMYRTLIDTKNFHEQTVNEILEMSNAKSVNPDEFHKRWDETFDDIYMSLGDGEFKLLYQVSVESLHQTMEEFGVKGDPEVGVRLWISKYDKADLYPEVQEVLNELSKKYPIIITSNVDNKDLGFAMLRRKNLPLKAIITSESSRSYKPDSKIFNDAISALKCQPDEILHIGDSQSADVLGGKKAGMITAWLNRPPIKKLKQDIPPPDYEIQDLTELLHILL